MKNTIVTIGREFGCGGRQIASCLAERMGVRCYDRKLLAELMERFPTPEEGKETETERKQRWKKFAKAYEQAKLRIEMKLPPKETISREHFEEKSRLLRELAEHESCVIVGRTGFYVFRDYPNALKIFLTADKKYRIQRACKKLNVSEGMAELLIDRGDEAREEYAQVFCGKSRFDVRNYDLVINVTHLQPEQVADFIIQCIGQKLKNTANE